MKGILTGATGGIALSLALLLRFTFRAPLLETGPLGVVSSLPSFPWIVGAVLAGATLGALLGRRGEARLVTPFFLSGLAAAIFVPGIFARAPFLAAFSGRFLDLVLVVSFTISFSRLAGPRLASLRPSPGAVAIAGFALFMVVGLRLSRQVGLSGDEPHYLLVAQSLLEDGDLAVQDDYRDEEYRKFYDGKIGARLAAGTPYSVHGIGVPLLILPGLALGGLLGVLLTESLLSALLLRSIYAIAQCVTSSRGAALFAALGFALTSPGLFLSVSAYPELPAALVATLLAKRLLDPSAPKPASAVAWMLALGALPFLHVKFLPLSVVLGAAFLYRFSTRRWPSLAGLALGILALVLFSYSTTGSFNPTASYGRPRIFLDRIPIGVAGLLFDQEFGLLLNAPLYLLGIAGTVSLYRRHALLGTLTLLALLSVLLPGAAHPLWSGGTSPPARFLFPALPLLMIAAAALVTHEGEVGVGRWAPSLLAASAGIALSMLLLPGGPFALNTRDGMGRIWEALSSSWDLTEYLPSLVRSDPRSLATAWALGALVALAVAAQVWRLRFPLAPPVSILVLGLWLQDLTGLLPSRQMESRWVTDTMREIARGASTRYLAVPSFEPLSGRELAERISLPIEGLPGDGDPRHWWSLSYSIPAGRYRVAGIPGGVAFYNGAGEFLVDETTFSSGIALERFRLRAKERIDTARLNLLEAHESELRALETVPIAVNLRLHSLEEDVYLDPEGFWVRKAGRASFALELMGGDGSGSAIALANGGVENRVVIESAGRRETLELAPWEERRIPIAFDGSLALFSISSEGGFRPSDGNPASFDHRDLGVLLRSAPFD